MIEGHVPAAAIAKLLRDRPDVSAWQCLEYPSSAPPAWMPRKARSPSHTT
ncbi:DUF411 domain-containing protein [Tianweitania sediminis]|uniref:Uncharacterized protein n=1 Tax=Tianweitania sediminis TaxID=1502156 RepID=A0A8J7R9F3_9HYPH|nr:hypothetical protein [Tianweitania sediminis]